MSSGSKNKIDNKVKFLSQYTDYWDDGKSNTVQYGIKSRLSDIPQPNIYPEAYFTLEKGEYESMYCPGVIENLTLKIHRLVKLNSRGFHADYKSFGKAEEFLQLVLREFNSHYGTLVIAECIESLKGYLQINPIALNTFLDKIRNNQKSMFKNHSFNDLK